VLPADPASTAIRAALARPAKYMISDPDYPVDDSWAATFVDFNTRLTDTLFALDQALAAL
jgi:hypothetical protein